MKVKLGQGGGVFVQPSDAKLQRQRKVIEFLEGFQEGTKLLVSVSEWSLKMLMKEGFVEFGFLWRSRGLSKVLEHCWRCEGDKCSDAGNCELTVEYVKDSEGLWVEGAVFRHGTAS